MTTEVLTYLDGTNEPTGYREVVAAFGRTWSASYPSAAALSFGDPVNLKKAAERRSLAPEILRIADIRNPDFFFSVPTLGVELGGVEITTHSPDGSNVEKRYPFLWASRRGTTDAFIACHYLKKRPGGQINRLPFRHAHRNSVFLSEWAFSGTTHPLCQIVPIRELHLEDLDLVPPAIRDRMFSWADLGAYFAHSLAARGLAGANVTASHSALSTIRTRLAALASACEQNTTDTGASSLLKESDRWIQIYNTRPDSGHWERGEGQFDSIDGRLMFTLDEIEALDVRPSGFEFWLPQVVSTHPWIAEQRARGFTSKKLRNIMTVLAGSCTTKFGDQLTPGDWDLLRNNRRLLLERLDWPSGVYHVADLVRPFDASAIARAGLSKTPSAVHRALEQLLSMSNLFFGSHRPYDDQLEETLREALAPLPAGSTALLPRIPRHMLTGVTPSVRSTILAAEDMTKEHLLMLRQLHRVCLPGGSS